MESFLFALEAIMPIILMVILGYFLKRIGLLNADFAKRGNKLVFRVLLPAMLFLNVYNIDLEKTDIGFGYIVFATVAVLVMFAIAIPIAILSSGERERRAPLIQAAFRSNYALIGLPLAESLFKNEGVAVASLLSAFSIPLFNVLAVLTFALFGGKEKPNIKKIFVDIAKNPLIIAVALSVVFLYLKNLAGVADVPAADEKTAYTVLHAVIFKILGYLSSTATPIALLMLGAQFEFSAIPELKKEIIIGTSLRTVIMPALAIGAALLLGIFNGAHFAAYVALFATPVAVSSAPMTQELGGDAKLAGQLVVWTTLLSAVTIFLFTFILKAIGIFG